MYTSPHHNIICCHVYHHTLLCWQTMSQVLLALHLILLLSGAKNGLIFELQLFHAKISFDITFPVLINHFYWSTIGEYTGHALQVPKQFWYKDSFPLVDLTLLQWMCSSYFSSSDIPCSSVAYLLCYIHNLISTRLALLYNRQMSRLARFQ